MKLKDSAEINSDVYGVFNIKSYNAEGEVIDDYTDNNLIVYTARAVMAGNIGDYLTPVAITPINSFVMGTRGHRAENILDTVLVGETQPGLGIFNPERSSLFSEESNEYNYKISFNPQGGKTVTRGNLTGTLRQGSTTIRTDDATNSVVREVTGIRDNELRYTITIETPNANVQGQATPYTEAALYAGDNLFAMKTFPARVKENTVKFVITWSIIF